MQQPTTTKREVTASVLDYVDDKYTEVSGCVCLKTYLPVSRVAQNACHRLRNRDENSVFLLPDKFFLYVGCSKRGEMMHGDMHRVGM